jgi:hypothetical protein
VAGATLKGDHYKMDIISSMGQPRSDSVVPLVLCMIVCNGCGTGIALQVSWDSTIPVTILNLFRVFLIDS